MHSTFPIFVSRNIWAFKDFSFHLNVWVDIGKFSQYQIFKIFKMLRRDFKKILSTLQGYTLTLNSQNNCVMSTTRFGYWTKACPEAHNSENNCDEWGYDIAIYGNSFLSTLPISLQSNQLLSNVFALRTCKVKKLKKRLTTS